MNEQVRPMMLEQAASVAKRAKQPLLSRRYALEIRQQLAWHWQAAIIGLALLLGLGISAAILIAGDRRDPLGPTYASFAGLLDAPPADDGQLLIQALDRDGHVTSDARYARYGVRAAYHVQLPGSDHQIASPFWEFINSQGPVYRAGRVIEAPLFEDRWSLIGYPLTEAYWCTVTLRGEPVDMLIQVFERRVLTYTPSEPAGWQVQFANVGRHYLDWRYGGVVGASRVADPADLPAPAPPDYAALRRELRELLADAEGLHAVAVLDLQTDELISIGGSRRQLAASTLKLSIMIAVARDISAGKYTADEVEHLAIAAMGPSINEPARELLRVVGDGDVAAGIDRVNAILREFGARNSLMTHPPGFWDEDFGYLERVGTSENLLTAVDAVRILAAIWRGQHLTDAERDYLLWSLSLTTPFLDGPIRAPLPDEATTFHKTGVIDAPENVWNDAGLVVFERAGQEYAYAVAFLSSDNPHSYIEGYYLNEAVSAAVWAAFSADSSGASYARAAEEPPVRADVQPIWGLSVR